MSNAPHLVLARLLARLSSGYPFAKVQAQIRAKRLDLIAPSGAHTAVAATVAELQEERSAAAAAVGISAD